MLVFSANDTQCFIQEHMASLGAVFVSFAIAEGRLMLHRQRHYYLPPIAKQWGGTNVFGSIYYLRNDFSVRFIDSYNVCSLSALGVNHKLDQTHRTEIEVTPIQFNCIDDFCRHRYTLGNPLTAMTWMANTEHPYFRTILNKYKRRVNGLDEKAFVSLYKQLTAK